MAENSRRRIDEPFRSNLRALRREFKRCSVMYRPLYHERLLLDSSEGTFTPFSSVSDESWHSFKNANTPDMNANEWWSWDGSTEADFFGRFTGCSDGLSDFKRLAESAVILFDEMEFPNLFQGYLGWLHLLHDVASTDRLPLLRTKPGILWDFDELNEHTKDWQFPPNENGVHLISYGAIVLVHSVFTSSMTLIESVLNPDSVIVTSPISTDEIVESSAELAESDEPQEAETTGTSHELGVVFPPNKNVFKKIGKSQMWMIQFAEGGIESEQDVLQEKAGFYYIQKLLSSEKQPISYLDLYTANPVGGKDLLVYADRLRVPDGEPEHFEDSGRRRQGSGESADDDVSEQTIAETRKFRRTLLATIEELKAGNDPKALKKAQDDLAFTNTYLSSVTNISGKSRQSSVKTPESMARTCVKRSLTPALDSLKHLKNLHGFLKSHLVPQGGNGRQYTKAGEVKWETS